MIDSGRGLLGSRIPCVVLGASGLVGQTFTWLLAGHPWFELTSVAGSGDRVGGRYGREIRWHLPVPLPSESASLRFESLDEVVATLPEASIVFSALPTDRAAELEPHLRDAGHRVFTNASALRMEESVPILIPEVNGECIDQVFGEGYPERGFVIANGNCAVSGLALVLAPLDKFGLKRVTVTTFQSLSGAGLPGPSALNMVGNIAPYIEGEEEKIGSELNKIMQTDVDTEVTCTRVPVEWGHLESVWVELKDEVDAGQIIDAWRGAEGSVSGLPGLPESAIVYDDDPVFPQPSQAFFGDPPGMAVLVGRLRVCRNRVGFVLLVNNLVRGAAGGSVANAELFVKQSRGATWHA